MSKPRRTIKVICQDCGITFDAKALSNLRCKKCKKAWANKENLVEMPDVRSDAYGGLPAQKC